MVNEMTSLINPLEPAVNEVYVSHLNPSIRLVRTGAEPQGSCFFHAVYTAFRDFRNMSPEEKKIYITNKRKELSDNISISSWFQIQNGDLAFLQIIEMMRIMVYMIPALLTDPKESQILSTYNVDIKVLEVLFHLLDPTLVDHTMLPNWDIECCRLDKSELTKDILLHRMKAKWHQIYQENIDKAINQIECELEPGAEKMTHSKRMAVIHKLSEISYFLFDFVVEKALLGFKEDISTYSTWINTFHYLYLVDSMNLQSSILFMDASTGLPYEGMRYFDRQHIQEKDSFIILLYFPDYHFECLGEQIVQGNRKITSRIFKKDHPLVQDFFSHLDTLPNRYSVKYIQDAE